MTDRKVLNKEQLQAVKYKSGPLLIIAGAGTGKTTVITEKIKYFINKNLAKTSEILALTFTEKAAREMEERVDVAMPYGYTQMWISTFHSFCDRILRANALHIGMDPNYKLNTQVESVSFIRRNLFKFNLDYFRPLGNPTKFVGGMLQHFSRLQDENINPNDYINWVNSKFEIRNSKLSNEEKTELSKWRELAKAYKTYEELKVKEGVLDFGDLIVKTLQLFQRRQNVLGEYKKQFKYILVDEFQDTNVAQYDLLKILVPPSKYSNLTVVGDDSQSIYKFRGAAVSNILYFKKDYKYAKTVILTKNYRSTQTILDTSYKLIRYNAPDTLEDKLGIDKNLVSNKSSKNDEPIKFIHRDRVENEADEVAKEISKLTTNNLQPTTYNYNDIAILVRANNHSEPFIRAFSRHGIPYQFLGPGRLFKQPEIIDMISYLKVLYDFEDSVSMYRLLSIDYFEIPARDLIRLTNYAKKKSLSLFEISEKIEEVFIADETKQKIKKILEIIKKHQKLIKKETAGQLLYFFLENTKLIQKLLNPDNPEAERKALNVSKFFDKLKTYEVEHEDATVTAVVDWIDLASELGESPLAADFDWTESNAVNILTVHSAKGLEFPVVFLVNLVFQRFPTIERREQIPIPDELIKEVLPEGDYHLEEERRLFYVGMTRAKNRLYLTAADYYGEGKREKKLSPFIFEALEDEAISAELPKEKREQLSFLDYQLLSSPQLLTTNYQPLIHIDYLSYSQIETFRICPLHFKLKYIYRLPTPATSSQSFGNSFHLTMKYFYEKLKLGHKPSSGMLYKTLEENWINEGYLGKSHEKSSFEKAKRFLKYYLNNFFNPKERPVVLEQPFTIRLDKLNVGGKIDRVDLHNDVLEIIDYKTGATPLKQKQAQEDLQLSIYGLAATTIPDYPFNHKPEKVKLSLMYFDTPQIVTTTRTKEQLEKAKGVIEDYKKQIEGSNFKCSHGYLCDEENCEYKLFCRTDER
ncbi:hypothetical protein A2159_00110 [Candidatus Woesebacteria bacterium RBG_13_34_9]|uniref:DNA 3'-5' helicase n=1 Tax=Candidatus Woesebacteria bacterium RBG_13_34_9 TaxID=1802477 RepID=A0A1F7X3I7_9BACT|nr:MAG: hypothetical protein A2159_00110 [Candidatus Woesebacteria bacterium RBG_13_34_9]